MINEFKEYMDEIITRTCGFHPTLDIQEPYPGTVQVWITGTPTERSLVMGKEAKNIQAISRLAHIFARRHNCFVYIYVKPKESVVVGNTLEDTLNVGKI